MQMPGLPVLRSVLLTCAIVFLLVLVNARAWVDRQLLIRTTPSALGDSLSTYIEAQLADKQIPGLSITVVDDQRTVLESGYGYADPVLDLEATPYTVYRGGALSQLFTTVAVLQRVELGKIHLDAPVATYLPDFEPHNPYGLPLTLRQMLSHQSGLPSEPPMGHAYDTTDVALTETVASLNRIAVVYPPEMFTKYSYAGYGVAGMVLEKTLSKSYALHMRAILDRMDMKRSSFTPRLDLRSRLARGYTLHFDGRTQPASVYEAGNAPAANLYTTANDLGTFMKVIFAGGESAEGYIISASSFEQMWTVPVSTARKELPYGLGFAITDFEGESRASLGGSFQGHTSRIDVLPEARVGVAILANMEHVDAVLKHIADYALRLLLSEQKELPAPAIPRTSAPEPAMVAKAAGYYEDDTPLYISALGDELYLYKDGYRLRVRQIGDSLIVDDRHGYGELVLSDGLTIQYKDRLYAKRDLSQAPPPTDAYDPILGAYGNPDRQVSIVEQLGRLYALESWLYAYPLTEVSADTFALPADGMYGGEQVLVRRDEQNRINAIRFANMRMSRLSEAEYSFHYEDVPFTQPVQFVPAREVFPDAVDTEESPQLVDLTMVDPLLNIDMPLAAEDNLFGRPLYNEARALLQPPVAEALFRIQKKVRRMGYSLVIYDAYRPWRITHGIWNSLPDSIRVFFDDPLAGSCQNRGTGISMSFYQSSSGEPLDMPTEYGVLSTRSHVDYPFLPASVRRNRAFLRTTMEEEGFRASDDRWWHFTHQSCASYPVIDLLFDDISHSDSLNQAVIYTIRG